MTGSGVSSLVRDILLVFADNMDMLFIPRRKKQRKHSAPPKLSQDELKLHNSLENRPKEIKAEYAQSVVKHGKRFEQGDQRAYSDLAQTLLILNTGLINLINHTLDSERADVNKSRQSLLLLSESAATSTKRALSQLDARLSSMFSNDFNPSPQSQEQRSEKQQTSSAITTRPGPSPLLERGGWVRSKSGSSVVSAATARRMASHSSKQQRRESPPAPPLKTGAPQTIKNAVPERRHGSETQDAICSCQSSPRLSETKWAFPSDEKYARPALNSSSSIVVVSADYFDTADAMNNALSTVPPRPPKIPLHSRPNPRARARPISAATFMTASTKIGEIPEHKWLDRISSEEEHERLPLPYVIPPPLQPPKKKSRGLRFWKKATVEYEDRR